MERRNCVSPARPNVYGALANVARGTNNKQLFCLIRCGLLRNCNERKQRAFIYAYGLAVFVGRQVTPRASGGLNDTGVETDETCAPNALFRIVQVAVRFAQSGIGVSNLHSAICVRFSP